MCSAFMRVMSPSFREADDITRFTSRDHFAAYNGTAPIEVSPGPRKIYRLSRRGNRRINHAVEALPPRMALLGAQHLRWAEPRGCPAWPERHRVGCDDHCGHYEQHRPDWCEGRGRNAQAAAE